MRHDSQNQLRDMISQNHMNKKIILGVVVGLAVIAGAAYYVFYPKGNICWPYCPGMTDKDREDIKKSASEAQISSEQKAIAAAREALSVLAARDYQKLEGLVSPDGLSLDIYPRFDAVRNLIAKNEVSEITKDTKVYLWGYTDGKGDPINLTRGEFLTKYIYSGAVDYSKAPNVAVNKKLGGGNSINTVEKDANGRTYVAFYFSGFDPKYAGMDWTTMYLIFDSVNGEYKLRAIAKDNWTI